VIERNVAIVNKLGLHARAAAKLVSTASGFASHVEVTKDGQTVNGKSIMGVMMLAASNGSTITLQVEGEDEQAAMDALVALIGERFGEPE
jgi:phosphocarrier protein